jgi:hypothetical protein
MLRSLKTTASCIALALAERKAVSLEEPAERLLADNDNDEWDRITPQFMTRPCWRDVIPDDNSHAA